MHSMIRCQMRDSLISGAENSKHQTLITDVVDCTDMNITELIREILVFVIKLTIHKNIGYILQGTEDDVVNWLHGSGLWKMAREPYEPLWIKGGGHCNLELYPDYICHLCRFIQEMENMTTEIRLKKIRQTLRQHKRSNSAARNSTNRCCKSEYIRSNSLDCSKANCITCCWWPKCSACRPKCPECRPKCLECITPGCMKYSCWCTNCSCSCGKCSCLCPRCSCW